MRWAENPVQASDNAMLFYAMLCLASVHEPRFHYSPASVFNYRIYFVGLLSIELCSKLLLRHDTDGSAVNVDDCTALHLICCQGHEDLA